MTKNIFLGSLGAMLAVMLALALGCSPGGPAPSSGGYLAFTAQPGGAVASVAFTAQPVVTINDARGIVTDSTAAVTISITTGTGASDGMILGTMNTGQVTVNAVKGVATFVGLAIIPPGSAYALTATSPGLKPAVSKPFDVAPAAIPAQVP